MPLKTPSAEEIGMRWAHGSARAIREAVEHPRDRTQYDWGLAFASLYIRRLTRKGNRQKLVSLSAALLRRMHLENCDKVLFIPYPEGGGFIRPATQDEIEHAHRLLTQCPLPTFSDAESGALPRHFVKACSQCGETFLARSHRRRLCDVCKRVRAAACKRAYWHRKGRRTPSYLAKLRRRGAAESAPMIVSA